MPRKAPSKVAVERSEVGRDKTSQQNTGQSPGTSAIKPRWDKELRELWYDGVLVKKFKRLARMVEFILNVFQEEGWPRRIDDPLTPLLGRREADRLRNEVANLNRRLDVRLIHFYLDGTGTGICWKPVADKP